MLPIIFEIPLPFEIFGHDHLPIRGFGLMVVLALIGGNWIAVRLGRKDGLDEEKMSNLFVVFTIAMVVGARAFYVLTNLDRFRDDPMAAFALHQGGMVFYGSFIGAFIAVPWYCRRAGLPILRVLDVYAVGAALGQGIGRIGCLLVGDDYGKACSEDLPWRIMFSTRSQDGSFLGITIPADNGNLCALAGQWLHPAQIYMSINGFLLCLVLRALWYRRRFEGQVVAVFVMLYAITRSVIELYRGDADRGFVGPLSTSQFVSLFVFVAGAVSYWLAWRRSQKLA
ncbi:MAG: prolipoprotein diacylglyceryl transferase [Planctomycetes bacterium]|nr:prolipoprotein diacylglyceryl transferase [Planctomycetota bacterium]